MKLGLFAAATVASAMLVGCSTEPDRNADGSFATSRGNISTLALHCVQKKIKPNLKDPRSFRKVDHSFTDTRSHINVKVNYTATNSFGGRVVNSKTCRYER